MGEGVDHAAGDVGGRRRPMRGPAQEAGQPAHQRCPLDAIACPRAIPRLGA